MKRANNYYFCLSLFLVSCVSAPKAENKNIEMTQVDSLALGSSKESVRQKIGSAKKFYILKKEDQIVENVWTYSDSKDLYDKVVFTFDAATGQVVGKTFVPIDEPEGNLEFLLQTKFRDIEFQKIPLKRCQDFKPLKTFYYNLDRGVSFEYNTYQKTIEYIDWSAPADIQDHIHRIETCQKSNYEMKELLTEP